ncbi:PorT family protein [Spirosoma sp. BT702]|uniref:PorT family protein n=1 Tax=Spirosoma profusum TaxID=2771354 RepID=A0A927AN60_9BACT|nr:porin family protein [Spirosoma profusum]MBD2701174.1 PorT family protein [Spirosoma profusum]
MKKLVLFISVVAATLPHTLQAQTKPTNRKPVSSVSPTNSTQPVPTRTTTAATPAKPATYSAPATPLRTSTTYQTTAQRPIASTSTNESRFRLGFRLGVNSTSISGFDFSSVGTGLQAERVTGFHAGIIFNMGGPNFSVQPEILFSQYGIRMTAKPDYLQVKYNIVEVPVMLKATFGQSDLRVFVNAGPVVTYTLGGTVSFVNGSQSGSQEIDMTGSGRLSYGAAAGTGIALKAGPGSFIVEGRFTYLFSTNENKDKLNPQSLMGSVGYLIPLGGR